MARAVPWQVANKLDRWADTTIRRMLGEATCHADHIIFASQLDSEGAGLNWKNSGNAAERIFTGKVERTVELPPAVPSIRLNGQAVKLPIALERIVSYVVRDDLSTAGKYERKHLEKRLGVPWEANDLGLGHGGPVHTDYLEVERLLTRCFVSGGKDLRDIGRVALLMRWPERGPNEGLPAHRWVEALRKGRPDLWGVITKPGIAQSRVLDRLRSNFESALAGEDRGVRRCQTSLNI